VRTVRDALLSARHTMATSSQDWSTARDFAWLWGILVGWKDDDGDPDEETLAVLADRFGWTPEHVERLKLLRAAVAEVTG
jgi:hypothetical protein